MSIWVQRVIMREFNILRTLSLVLVSFFVSSHAFSVPLNLPPQYANPQQQFPELKTLVLPTPSLSSKLANDGCPGLCPNYQTSEPSILKYKEKDLYKYKIEGLTSIHLPNSLKGEGTKLNYVASFEIAAEDKCSFILRVTNVDIIGPDGRKYADPTLSRYPARFTWSNGQLEKLCLDKQELTAAANFKRSIITNLQLSSLSNVLTRSISTDGSSLYESDMYGRCSAVIEHNQEPDGSWIFKKSKDLSQCKNRQGFDFATNLYESDNLLQTNPFVEANLRSVSKVEKGIITSVLVEEAYNYQPLSKYTDSLTSVVVTTKITYAGRSKNGYTSDSFKAEPATLMFETMKSQDSDASFATIVRAIQEASQEDDAGTVLESAVSDFSKLVSVLRQAKKQDLLTTFAQVKSGAGFKHKDRALAVFWGGLISAARPATVETAATLMANGEMPDDKSSDFMASLSFVKHPTKETLATVSLLIDGSRTSANRFLAVGSLIRQYVIDHPSEVPPDELKFLIEKLAAPLRKGGVCRTIEEEDLVIASLKGIRNAQSMTPEVAAQVRSIASNKKVTNRVRASALQAMMVNPSDTTNNNAALDIFKNLEEDAELRLLAFLVYTDFPTPEIAQTVKDLLDTEQSDQVISYITSYLRNLRNSADPKKEILKQYYGNIKTKNKYLFDFKQYSQNYEFSQLLSAMNLGYSAEANVFFSSQSFVPRFATLSLNSYLFGNSLNLFEIGARLQNFEYLIEKFLGPRSYLSTNDAEDIADDLTDAAKNLFGQMTEKATLLVRTKRELKDMQEIVANSKSKQKTPLSDKYLDIDLTLKMFDSEILWGAYHTDKINITSGEYLDSFFKKIQEAIESAKNFKMDYQRYSSSPIISNNVILYPTSCGFPLKLSTNAISVVDFKMTSSVNVVEMMQKPQSTNLRFSIFPSATLHIDGMLEIDASVVSAGLKGASSVRSATGMDIGFELLDGRGFDLKFALPLKQQDIFTMKTEAFATMQERGQLPTEIVLKAAGKRYEYNNTFDQLSLITGLSLQTEISSPAFSYKPTPGPAKLSFRLVKADDSLQIYTARAFYNYKEDGYRSLELLLDTPGSKVNRKVAIFGEANLAENKYVAKFEGWMKRLSAEANATNKENEISFNINLKNDAAEYFMKLGATIINEKYRTIYKPFCELKTPLDVRDISLDKLRLVPRSPAKLFSIDGSVILQKKKNQPRYRKYDFKELALTSPYGKLMINGPVQIDSGIPQFDTNLTVGYGEKNTINLQSNLNYVRDTAEEKKVEAVLAVMMSQWPTYGFKLGFQTIQTSELLDRTMEFTHGPDLDSNLMKVTLKELYHWTLHPKNRRILSADGSIHLSYPLWKLSADLKAKKENNNFYGAEVDLVMDKTDIKANGSIGMGNREPGNIDFYLESRLNERSLNIKAIRELVNEDQSKVTINASTVPGKQISVDADITHRLKPQNFLIEVKSTINVQPDNTQHRYELGAMYTLSEKSAHLIMYPNNKKSVEVRAGYIIAPPSMKADAVLYVKNVVDGFVTIERRQSKLDGKLKLHILKLNRLITGNMNLSIKNDETYEGSAELLWDASRDVLKKIKITTDTTIKNENRDINTKNTVQFVDYIFQANGNFKLIGELENGDIIIDADFILPNGSTFGGDLFRSKRYENSILNYGLKIKGYYGVSKSREPTRVSYMLDAKGIDTSNFMFDVLTGFEFSTAKMKNMQMNLAARRMLLNKIWTTGGNISLDGSLMKKKLSLVLDTKYSDLINDFGLFNTKRSLPPTTFHLSGNLGDDYAVDFDGNLQKAELNHNLQLKLPASDVLTQENMNPNSARELSRPFTLEWITRSKFDIQPSTQTNIQSFNKVTWNEVKSANWNATLVVSPKNGKLVMDIESSDSPKRSIDMYYGYDIEQPEGLKGPFAEVGVNLTFNGKPANCVFRTDFTKDLSTKSAILTGYSPTSKNFEVRATSKSSDNGRSMYNDLSLKTDANHWFMSSLVNTNPKKPAIDLHYTSPEGESYVTIKLEEHVPNYWSGSADIVWQHGSQGYVKANGELKLDTADDILVKATLDSPVLGVNNFSLVTTNKATDAGKKLSFTTKSDGVKQYSGTVSYLYQRNSNNLKFEGAGFIKMQDDKSRPIMFKYNHQLLTEAVNGKTGSSNNFYFSLDNKKFAVDLEAEFTDNGFLLKRDLWHGDKVYKLDVLYQTKTSANYEERLLAHIDLKPYIPNGEEFTIEGRTTRSVSGYDHRLSFEWAPEKKIEYNVYSTSGKSGFSLTLPQRQIAGEAIYSYKLNGKDGNIELTGNIWFDKKRNVNEKLMMSVITEYKMPEDKNIFVLRSTAGVQIPTLPKNLKISTSMLVSPYDEKTVEVISELDVFKKPEQTIEVTYQVFKGKKDNGYRFSDVLKIISQEQKLDTELVRSTTLYLDHIEYNFAFSYMDYQQNKKTATADFEVRLSSVAGKIQIFETLMLSGKAEISIGRNFIQLKEDFNLLGHAYETTSTLTTDPRFLFILEWKGKIRQKAAINATLLLKQFLKVDVLLAGRGQVTQFTLFLDNANFMKSETQLNIDNAEILLDNGKADLDSLIIDGKRGTRSVMDEVNKQLNYRMKQFRNASVDVKPLLKSANNYLMKMRDEIKNDTTLMSASQNVQKIIYNVADFILVMVQQVSTLLGDWISGYNELLDKIMDFVEKLSNIINSLMQLSLDDIVEWMRQQVNQLAKLVMGIIEYVKANKDKWKEALAYATDSIQESFKIIYETFEQFRNNAVEFYEKMIVYLQSLPITSYLKEKFDLFKNSQTAQYLWSLMRETAMNLREMLPTPELKLLFDTILSTVDKMVNDKPYDMKTELANIYRQLLECIRSLVNAANNSNYIRELANIDYSLPTLSFPSLKSMPNLWDSAHSVVNWLRGHDLSSMEEFAETYKIGNINLQNLFPPYQKVAAITDGQVVTMNGNNYAIDADCQYLLAGDLVNFNFTVTATIKQGKMRSIAVASDSHMIELYPDSNPKLNKALADYPVYGDGVFALRTPYSINAYVDNSVFVTCTPKLNVCVLRVSGFYQNMVYGLLGSVTADSYADFTMPDMTIAKDVPTFIKSYQLGKSCKDSSLPSAPVEMQSSSECATMFNGKSVLKRGLSFVKTKPYRDMCERVVASKSTPAERLDAACTAGMAFSLVSHVNGYLFSLPPECGKCSINESIVPYGFTTNVQAPAQTADIAVVLEKTLDNEILYRELLVNALNAIKNSLKTKGISDVNVVLLGYGPADKYPSLHTTDGKPTLSEKTNVEFSNLTKSLPTSNLGRLVRNVKYLLGFNDARRALELVNEYPFRAGALSTVIEIVNISDTSTTLDQYNIYNTLVNAIASRNIVSNKIPIFLVSSMESDGEIDLTTVFGADLNNVYTAKGPKPFENGAVDKLNHLQRYKASGVLPLSSNGAVFNSSVFKESQPNVRNQLANVFANAVFNSLVSHSRYSDCTCKYRSGVYSEMQCSLSRITKI